MERKAPEILECAVCLESCNHPTQLPCGHIFCFLCAKGVAIQNRRCAMCRQDIPADYLEHPVLVQCLCTPPVDSAPTEPHIQWYYEGRNGWWKYDERSNSELEAAHAAGAAECRLLLAGALYHVDFRTLLQYRRNDATRRRRVKRDTSAAPAKGIAGIKLPSVESERAKSPDHEAAEVEAEQRASEELRTPVAPRHANSEEAPASEHIIPPPHPFSITNALRSLSLNDADTVELNPPIGNIERSD